MDSEFEASHSARHGTESLFEDHHLRDEVFGKRNLTALDDVYTVRCAWRIFACLLEINWSY